MPDASTGGPAPRHLRLGCLALTAALALCDGASMFFAVRTHNALWTTVFLVLGLAVTGLLGMVLLVGRRDVWLRVLLGTAVLGWTVFKLWNAFAGVAGRG